jgi:SAM-dependent methyltransferase
MGAVEEFVLKSVVRLRTGKPAKPQPTEHDWAAYIKWQYKSSSNLFAKYPNFDVTNKSVLEIGCGTGGRTAYLAAAGAKRAVGIDINKSEIATATQVLPQLYPELGDRLEFHACQENAAVDIGKFDVVMLIDCLEHVVSPPDMLRLAHDYTAEGGRCFVSLYGWYHARGSHFGMMPFVNLVFSDEAILNVQRWQLSQPDYVPSRFDSDPPIERWRGLYDLRQRPGEYLNKITLREMKKLIKYSAFRRAGMHVVGFARDNLVVKAVNALRHVPILQEVLHSYIVLEFQK